MNRTPSPHATPHADDASRAGTPTGLALQMDALAHRLLRDFPHTAEHPPTLLFTSAREGEGKTTLACAVAHSLARLSGQPVLLADANPYRPQLHTRYHLADTRTGLFDLLRDAAQCEPALPKAPAPGQVTVLPAGASPDATLLFRDAGLRHLRRQTRAYRFVLLDGGTVPLGGSALAPHADGVVLVIDSSSTRREVVQGSVAALRLPSDHWLQAVLNKRQQHIPRWLYRSL